MHDRLLDPLGHPFGFRSCIALASFKKDMHLLFDNNDLHDKYNFAITTINHVKQM